MRFLAWMFIGLAIVGCRRSQTMRDDAGAPIMCVSPTESRPCTVGEYEDMLAADIEGCSGTRTSRCRALGIRYRLGQGVPVDEARATALFAKGCAAGDIYACPQYTALDSGLWP